MGNLLKRGIVRLVLFVLIVLAVALINTAIGIHLGDSLYNVSLLIAVGIYWATINAVLRKLGLTTKVGTANPWQGGN